MFFRPAFFALLLLHTVPLVAQSLISEDVAKQHLKLQGHVAYPPIAKAAHVFGVVEMRVGIDETGKVTAVDVVSGPMMLRAAAVEGTRQSLYVPFPEGKVVAIVKTDFSFSGGVSSEKSTPPAWVAEDLRVGQEYFPQDDACRKALHAPSPEMATAVCEKEVAIAGNFPNEGARHLEIMQAHQNYGTALLAAHKPDDALTQFDQSIALAQHYLNENNAEFAYPYYWRSIAWQMKGDAPKAIADLSAGEHSLRLAIHDLPTMSERYKASLSSMLKRHAALLDATGDKAGAQALLQQAPNP
ncbi:MAG TPA: energy transducer TonB [Terriglobus sp.]